VKRTVALAREADWQNMNSSTERKVLVLGDDTRSFLSVIRSLGRAGIEVHVAWYGSDVIACRSRYVARAHELPEFSDTNDHWKVALIRLLQQEKYDLVIPCSDPVLLPLQKHRGELERYGRLYLLDDCIQQIVSDKLKTVELARSVGVCVPQERVITHLSQVTELPQRFQLPVVLKPRYSFDPGAVGAKHMVKKAYSWQECFSMLAQMLTSGPVAVQQNFIGVGVGVELLLAAGEPLMTFQHIRIHEPLHGGGSSYRKGVAVAPELLQASLKLLGPLRYTGVAMVEFKVNMQTGEWVLIEINGRFWGSLPLALASGADFPLALYQLLVQGRTSFPQRVRCGLYCRNLTGDLRWQLANLRADRTDPTLATLPLTTVLKQTVANILVLRERSDTFVLDDPVPGFAEIACLALQGIDSLRYQIGIRYLQLPLVRSMLAQTARKALIKSRTVLFVCKGNVCRSPFAELLVRPRLSHEKTVTSAGYIQKAGRPAPETAVGAAQQWEVDLSEHCSRILTPELMSADAIFVFDYDNYIRVRADYPHAASRVHFVGALHPKGELFIADPWGQDAGQFSAVYQQIADALLPHLPEPRPLA
jgi:protein-tyrosine-phosphatase/predicted ATP-grasp superfamily ATP-dependent carboligase